MLPRAFDLPPFPVDGCTRAGNEPEYKGEWVERTCTAAQLDLPIGDYGQRCRQRSVLVEQVGAVNTLAFQHDQGDALGNRDIFERVTVNDKQVSVTAGLN